MFELPQIEAAPRIPNRIGLIDADVVAYWAAAGCDDMPKQSALRKVKDRIAAISDQIQTDEIRCYLTGKDNFRDDVARYQIYKGNRYDKDGNRIKPQPVHLAVCREFIAKNYTSTIADGEEADDLLAIAQTKCNAAEGWHSIISTIDKDLLQVPGLHHDMNSGYVQTVDTLGTMTIDPKGKVRGTGLKFFYTQLLMGDAADWIPGLPKVTKYMKETFEKILRLGGCGEKGAYAVTFDATDEYDLFKRVMNCYASYWDGQHWFEDWRDSSRVYPTPLEALTEQGQLLWMRRTPGEMWSVPQALLDRWITEEGGQWL